MAGINKAIIVGNLGANPEVRRTQSNIAVATLSVATSQKYKDGQGELQEKTEWHRVIFWGRTAEVCNQYLKKGSQIYVEGKLETRKWTDKEGTDRWTTEIKGQIMQMLGGGSTNAQSKPVQQTPQSIAEQAAKVDDDLPF